MADENSGRARRTVRNRRWGPVLVLMLASVGAQAEPWEPHEVVVTPDPGYPSAINEDGVIEANVARVEEGVVYLEYRSAQDTRPDLRAAAR